MKKRIFFIIIVLLLVASALLFQKYFSVGIKKKICPDAWYENRMPRIYEEVSEVPEPYPQYFIIDGERVELEKLDVDWVMKNCEVNEPSFVY